MQYPSLKNYNVIGYDTETTGLIYPVDKMFGFSIATENWEEYWDIRKNPESIDWIKNEMRDFKGIIAAHNMPFDYKMSLASGLKLPIDRLDDTVNRACQINEHEHSYELDNLAKKYLKEEKESDLWQQLADLFGGRPTRNAQISNLYKAPPDIVSPYAKQDAGLVLKLWYWQENEIQHQGIRQICEFERKVMPTIIRNGIRGIRVDIDAAEKAATEIKKSVKLKQKQLDALAGCKINVNSSVQVKKMLNPKKKSDGQWYVGNVLVGKTNKGEPSLKAEYLMAVAEKDERAGLIQEIRSLIKTADTFLLGHICGHAYNGRVYPTVNQNKGPDGGTGTGRLSYTDPALQQIPSRNKEVASKIKPAFLPDEGMVWVDTDMASFEVRIFAHLVNNPKVIEAYRKNPHLDFHQFVADLTKLVRNATYSGQPNAKQLNLSMIFNSGNGAIADKMGMPWSWESFVNRQGQTITYKKAGPEAEAIISRYHRKVPGVRELAEKAKKLAERTGYVFTHHGRRLRFPKGYKSYSASGLLIQATSADVNKENWINIEDALGNDGHLILNTHDSYSMCLPENWKPYYKKVEDSIQNGYPWVRVPLLLELSGSGSNWWEALSGDNK